MVPFMPPPPSCAARPFHSDGNATWKLIGLAFGARSTGAIAPFTVQYGGKPFAAAFQRGALRVTADTGSPIVVIGMLSPSLAALQSASVIALELDGSCAPAPTDQINAAAATARTIEKRESVMKSLPCGGYGIPHMAPL